MSLPRGSHRGLTRQASRLVGEPARRTGTKGTTDGKTTHVGSTVVRRRLGRAVHVAGARGTARVATRLRVGEDVLRPPRRLRDLPRPLNPPGPGPAPRVRRFLVRSMHRPSVSLHPVVRGSSIFLIVPVRHGKKFYP